MNTTKENVLKNQFAGSNYRPWALSIQCALMKKGLFSQVRSSVMSQKPDEEIKDWEARIAPLEQNDEKAIGIIIDSIHEDYVLSVMAFNNAFQMWEYMRITYDKAMETHDLMAIKETFYQSRMEEGSDVNVYFGVIEEFRRRLADVETIHISEIEMATKVLSGLPPS